MADTLPNVAVSREWQAVSVLTGIAAGKGCVIQNQGSNEIYVAIMAEKPPTSIRGVVVPPKADRPYYVQEGSSEVWIRGNMATTGWTVNIQEVD